MRQPPIKTLQKARLSQARRKMSHMAERVRVEVLSTAFTRLEEQFGLQPEPVLEAIDRDLNRDLKAWDHDFWKRIERNMRPNGLLSFVPEDVEFAQVLRDEVLDLMGQHAQSKLSLPRPSVEAWVSALTSDPELRPEALATARRRMVA